MIQAFIKYAIGLINEEPGYTLTNAKRYFGKDYELFLDFYHNLLCSSKAIAEYQKRKDKGWDLPQLTALALAFTKKAVDSIKKVVDAGNAELSKQRTKVDALRKVTTDFQKEKILNLNYSKLLGKLTKAFSEELLRGPGNKSLGRQTEVLLNKKIELLNKSQLTAEEIELVLTDTFDLAVNKIKTIEEKTSQILLKTDKLIVDTVNVINAIGEVSKLTDIELQAELTQQIQIAMDEV